VYLTILRNLLETSDNTKAKRYDDYLPIRELDLKEPHATNHNQSTATGPEDVDAVVPHPSTVGTGPCNASGGKDNAIEPANTAMAQLDTINATYLQPLSTFNAVVTGIANVCLPN